jgi:protein-tyrosine phosphatase
LARRELFNAPEIKSQSKHLEGGLMSHIQSEQMKKILSTRIAQMNGFFDHPICSHICDNLYVGMSPVYWPLKPTPFNLIINTYVFEDYEIEPHQVRHDLLIRDTEGEAIHRAMLKKYAILINEARKEHPVLVHCQMGINRSNLLAGLALVMEGMSAPDAVKLLRDRRSQEVLMNRNFHDFLLRFNPDL